MLASWKEDKSCQGVRPLVYDGDPHYCPTDFDSYIVYSSTTTCRSGARLELRKTNRYQLRAWAQFSWEGPQGLQEGDGWTRDVSSGSVFIVCNAAPPVASRIDLEINLPPTDEFLTAVHLRGEGRVVRIEQRNTAGDGFAAEVNFRAEPSSGVGRVHPRSTQ